MKKSIIDVTIPKERTRSSKESAVDELLEKGTTRIQSNETKKKRALKRIHINVPIR